MLDAITKELIELGYLEANVKGEREIKVLQSLIDNDITTYGEILCQQREYPKLLAHRNISEPIQSYQP